jgi:nicotinate-nucleotide pyrophosphorylase (carboxylating)
LLPRIDTLIDLALEEDAAFGDVTSESIFTPDQSANARINAGQDLTLCGIEIARRVFERVDPSVRVKPNCHDGQRIEKGRKLLSVSGPVISLLIAERTALNFLQRLSGIATLSRRFAAAAQQGGTGVRIVDTRKTTPGWRALEKYAVRCGGCFNHRSSLGEHVLIKDNHIAAAGSIGKAVMRVRKGAPHGAKVEVEAASLAQVKAALKAGAEIILLDNMNPQQIKEAVSVINGAALVEVSGGVRLETIADFVLPGVDVISVGALTHSATAVDISMTLSTPRKK